jgi:hypothetical protein
MAVVFVAVALSVAFGGADQYLGSLSAHPWTADVSLLSAPWLVLALVGYGLMTLNPVENAHLTTQSAAAFLRSESRVVVGGLITGPLFGWLGNRWRNDRAWLGALAAAGAVCLEPLARLSAGEAIRFRTVWVAEVAVGLAMVTYVATTQTSARRHSS